MNFFRIFARPYFPNHIKILICCLILLSWLTPAFALDGEYQGTWTDSSGVNHTEEPSYGSGSSSSSGGGYSGPSWAEIREQQRQQKASNINDQGNVYFSNGDYATAVKYYEEALSVNPNDGVIANNLRRARGSLKNVEGLALAKEGKYREALVKYKEAYALKPESEGIRQNLEYAQSVVDDWDEQKRREEQNAQVAQGLAQQLSSLADNLKGKRSTAIMGEQNKTGGGLQLMGMDTDFSAPAKPASGGNTSAGAQAKSVLHHSQQAASALSDEEAKAQSGMGFDTAGTYQGDANVVDLRGIPEWEQDPAVPEEYQSDPEIKEYIAKRIEVRQERKELEKQLETLEEEPAKDTVKIAKIKMEISNIQNKEVFLNFSIKERLKKPPVKTDEPIQAETPKKTEGLQLMPLKGNAQ